MKIQAIRRIAISCLKSAFILSLLTGCGGGGTSSGGQSNGVKIDIADPTLKAIVKGALHVLDIEDREYVEKHTRTIEARPLSGLRAGSASNQGLTTLDPAFLIQSDVYQVAGVLVHESVHHQQGHSSTRPHSELEREAYERQLITLRKLNVDTAWIERLLSHPACC